LGQIQKFADKKVRKISRQNKSAKYLCKISVQCKKCGHSEANLRSQFIFPHHIGSNPKIGGHEKVSKISGQKRSAKYLGKICRISEANLRSQFMGGGAPHKFNFFWLLRSQFLASQKPIFGLAKGKIFK